MSQGLGRRARVASAVLALALAQYALNPHQRRGPDGRWVRMPGSALRRPRRPRTNRGSSKKIHTTEMVWASQVPALLAEVKGDSERDEFIRQALQGAATFAGTGITFVARDQETGKLAGAITAVEHEDIPGKPYFPIDRLGAYGGGA